MSIEKLHDIENRLHYLIELDLGMENANRDPLALATYFHFLNKHHRTGISKSAVANWARAFCQEVILEKRISKKRDTEIAAAILLAAELRRDSYVSKETKKSVVGSIRELLKNEVDADHLYFGNPTLSAIILYGLQELNVIDDEQDEVLEALFQRYENKKTFNHLFGLLFLVKALVRKKDKQRAERLVGLASERLQSQRTDYEDRLYLAAALWEYCTANHHEGLLNTKHSVEAAIKHTPILISDIVNKGDLSELSPGIPQRKISRLYKAVLFDVIENYKEWNERLERKALDRRYTGTYGLKWSVVFATLVTVSIPPTITWLLFRHKLNEAVVFWIFQDVSFSWTEITINSAISFVFGYVILAAIAAFLNIFNSIIIEGIASERRILEKLLLSQRKILKVYWISIVTGVFIVAVLQLVIGGALQKKIGIWHK